MTKALENRKVLLLLGARQVGKTTLLSHILSSRRGAMLNMDIEVDRARLLAASHLEPAQAIKTLGGKEVLIIDEAQRVPEIGRICKGWYDARVSTKIILLGSSSATLLDAAAADLTGRNEKVWLTPLLWQEILGQQKWFSGDFSAADLHQHFPEQIKGLLLDRMVFGSYPEAYLASDPASYLTNLSNDYLLKDIFMASLVRSPEDVKRLLLELAIHIGQSVSVLQLATRLHLSRQTVERYLALLEGIFVVFGVPAYSTDPIKEVSKSTKYYFWDTGVKNALQREWVVSPARSDINSLWENWVLAEIIKQSRTDNRQEDIFFWESRNQSVVNLVVKKGTQLHAFDIRFDPQDYNPSRSFKNMYNLSPALIHPENFLEYIL